MVGHLLIARPVIAIVVGKAAIFYCGLGSWMGIDYRGGSFFFFIQEGALAPFYELELDATLMMHEANI